MFKHCCKQSQPCVNTEKLSILKKCICLTDRYNPNKAIRHKIGAGRTATLKARSIYIAVSRNPSDCLRGRIAFTTGQSKSSAGTHKSHQSSEAGVGVPWFWLRCVISIPFASAIAFLVIYTTEDLFCLVGFFCANSACIITFTAAISHCSAKPTSQIFQYSSHVHWSTNTNSVLRVAFLNVT